MILQTAWGLLSSFRRFCLSVSGYNSFRAASRRDSTHATGDEWNTKGTTLGFFWCNFRLLGRETWVIFGSLIKAFECQWRNGYMLIDGWLLTKEDLEDKALVAASLFWCLSGFQWFWKLINHDLVDFLHIFHWHLSGLIVLGNAIAMGVRTDCQCGSDLLWQVLDNIFLVAFIIEFCLRAIISGIKQFGVMLVSDSWLQFDLMVVTLSIVDTWILGGVGSGGVYTLARLYRLLKLVKMVRVLRAFRQLAMLVEGILSSLQTLFWAVLLLGMTIFILGVLLVTMSQWNLPATIATVPEFTALPSAMWTLVQIATFDGWVAFVRSAKLDQYVTQPNHKKTFVEVTASFRIFPSFVVTTKRLANMWCFSSSTCDFGDRTTAFDLGDAHGTALAVVILLSACLTGLGLMNLVVGILCNTAFKLEARQSRTQGAERLVSQQEARRICVWKAIWHENPSTVHVMSFLERGIPCRFALLVYWRASKVFLYKLILYKTQAD